MSRFNDLIAGRLVAKGSGPQPTAWWEAMCVSVDGSDINRAVRVLTSDERTRIGRLKRLEDRNRSIVGRAATKLLLAEKLGIEPEAVTIDTGLRGRPFMVGGTSATLDFNVSHASDQVAIALSNMPVGIDIEHIHEIDDVRRLASTYFACDELAEVCNSVNASHAFLRYWVIKEALLKATGEGLANLQDIHVRETRDGGVMISRSGQPLDDQWRAEILGGVNGYVLAICVAQTDTVWVLDERTSM